MTSLSMKKSKLEPISDNDFEFAMKFCLCMYGFGLIEYKQYFEMVLQNIEFIEEKEDV